MTRRRPLNPDRLKRAQKLLGLSNPQFAQVMGVQETTVARWRTGGPSNVQVPATAQRLLAAYLDGYRPPDWPDPYHKR